MNHSHRPYRRRTVLKTIGAGVVGSAVLAGSATAHDGPKNNRRQDTFTWANGTLFEMFDTDLNSPTDESDGNEAAHRTLWVIKSMTGTGVDGAEHSPHPAPIPGIDHVVPLPPGPEFTAQWHVHFVTDGPPNGQPPTNFARTDRHGNYLTSADAIESAASDPDDSVVVTEFPEVFTCPIRPHKGPDA